MFGSWGNDCRRRRRRRCRCSCGCNPAFPAGAIKSQNIIFYSSILLNFLSWDLPPAAANAKKKRFRKKKNIDLNFSVESENEEVKK